MLRFVAKLAVIPLLLFVGVSLWYTFLEEKLQSSVPAGSEQVAKQPDNPPVAEDKTDQVTEPVGNQVDTDIEMSGDDFDVIVSRNIFQAALDDSGKDSEPEPVEAKDLEETQLQLVLLGTVTGNKKDSRAIIVDKKERKQDIFHIGDAIQGAIISQIDRGQVVIEVNGQPEVLKLKDREGGGPGAPATATARRAVTSPGGSERTVPVARPRRRISFRNPGPSAAVEAATPEISVDEPEAPLTPEDVEIPQEGETDVDPESKGESTGEEDQVNQSEQQQG